LPRAQHAAVHITFNSGKVTVAAGDVLISEVLAEWARVGGTVITGMDRLPPAKVTVNLAEVDEQSAIDAVIGSAAGYVSKLRPGAPGESSLMRLVIFPRTASDAAPAPPRTIDMSIPESKYAYPAPFADDLDLLAAQQSATRPASTSRPADELIPELRYRYTEPMAVAPMEPEAKPQEDQAAKPGATVRKPSR
jgi:hypothetical protein